MNGKIWVESEYGVGSSFKFVLPLQVQELQKNQHLAVPPEMTERRVLMGLFNTETEKTLVEMLDEFGFLHDCADTLEKLKEKNSIAVSNNGYAFVVIDWPVNAGKSEGELVEIIKHSRKRRIPVILVSSAFYENKKLDTLIKKSMVWSLHKPFNYSSLFDTIMLAYGNEGTKSALYKRSSSHFLDDLKTINNVKVLLVEDNEANQQIGIEMLGLAGVSVEVAENGKVAVDKLSNSDALKSTDLILMDIQMPVLDGYKAAQIIKEMPGNRKPPVVAMTADTVGNARQKYLAAGMVDMISKPIEPDELYRKVAKWVMKRRGDNHIELKEKAVVKTEQELPEGDIVIEGINVKEGIKRFANRWDFFKRLLERFYSDHINFHNDLDKALDGKDEEITVRLLHSFKGISGTIASVKLYPLAIELEKAFIESMPGFEILKEKTLNELSLLLKELENNEHLSV